jgi:hypothetical protein
MISIRIFFFPESCVRQFAETSGNDTFTAWAREKPYTGSTVSTVRQCKAMQVMIQRARDVYPGKNVVCIPVFDWRDDADPAVSVKSNRQLWCKSNTVSPPHGKKMALTTHTLLDRAARNKTTILSESSILPS